MHLRVHMQVTGASVANEQPAIHPAPRGTVEAEALPRLWESLRDSHDPTLRHRLIEYYMPLARKLAAQIYRHALQPCSFDDYLQSARLGLIEAVDSYDLTRHVPFEVYSRRRIRGCILNAVGRESEAAAQREFVRRAMPQRVASLGSPGSSLQQLVDLTLGIALGVLLERDELEVLDECPERNPYAVAELAQLAQRVRALVEHLPEREGAVISGHYFERVEFRVLAERLAVSNARVSQLHKQGLERLQRLLTQMRVNRTV